ncbi:MAG TPA: hypothetical protein VI685_18245 [Candidatus Angelobacter sp.]
MRLQSVPVNENRKTDVALLGWDALIRDARKKIEDLNFSIKVFEKRKLAGEDCPLENFSGDHQQQEQRSV